MMGVPKKMHIFWTFVTLMMLQGFISFTSGKGGNTSVAPEKRTIIIGGDWSFPPFEYIENGKSVGFNVDLTKAIMEKIHQPYVIRLGKWDDIVKQLQAGKIDMVMGMNYTDERAKHFKFGATHGFIYQDAVYRKNTGPYRKFEQLKDKRIAVEANSVSWELLHNAGYDANAVLFTNMRDALRLLSIGHFDVAMCDRDMAHSIILTQKMKNLNMSDLGLPPQEYCFASNNRKLLDKIEIGFAKISKEGTYSSIYNRWFAEKSTSYIPHIVYIIFFSFLLALLLLYIFVHILRRRVNSAKRELQEKNLRLRLAIKAGNTFVWGFNVRRQRFYNVECDFFPLNGNTFEEELTKFHPDDRKAFTGMIRNAELGILPSGPLCFRMYETSGGQWHYIEKVISVIRDENGAVETIIGTHHDITHSILEHKREEELLHKYQTMFNTTLIGLEYYDGEGTLVDMNDTACAIFGILDKRVLINARYSIYHNPVMMGLIDKNDPKPFYGTIQVNPSDIEKYDRFNLLNRREIFFLEVSIVPVFFSLGELNCIIVSVKDVTEEQTMQRLLEENIAKTEYAIKSANLILWEVDSSTMKCTCYNEPLTNFNEDTEISFYDLLQYVHKEEAEKMQAFIADMGKGIDKISSVDVRMKTPFDSSWRYCTIVSAPFSKDAKDSFVTKYVGFRRDNTQIIALNNEVRTYAERLNYVLKVSDVQVWTYYRKEKKVHLTMGDGKVNVLTVEEYLADIHESSREEVRARLLQMDEALLPSYSVQQRMRVLNNVEGEFYVEADGVLLKDDEGKPGNYFGLRRNITDLIMTQINLEKEKEKALQADKLKSAFLANMSHEIRTPLNAIVGFSNLLQFTEDKTERDEYVKIIDANNDLLLRLINDILDLSKIESGIVEMEDVDFDMTSFFGEFTKSLQQRLTNPQVKFVCEIPYKSCNVHADLRRMAQILNNFMTNAIKYTPSGQITAGYSCEGEGIRIFVQDTGIGIPQEKQGLIFQRFEKLDSFAPGTGLGLSICKAIVDTYHGKIGFRSEEGKGSLFWAWIPCKPVVEGKNDISSVLAEKENADSAKEKETARPAKAAVKDTCHYNILVAEDNDSNYRLTKAMLSPCHLERAKNGIEAVNMVMHQSYDIILMDIKMPVMDGLEATRFIRRFNAHVPIVALTAYAFDDDRNKALEAGCNDYVSKPIDRDVLFAKMQEQLVKAQECK
jgi:signal transduction histidine kinase/CheY-like chemotaxis protein/ABC-type amino acid transport substrate-binding protein/PAS domain-containing protein